MQFCGRYSMLPNTKWPNCSEACRVSYSLDEWPSSGSNAAAERSSRGSNVAAEVSSRDSSAAAEWSTRGSNAAATLEAAMYSSWVVLRWCSHSSKVNFEGLVMQNLSGWGVDNGYAHEVVIGHGSADKSSISGHLAALRLPYRSSQESKGANVASTNVYKGILCLKENGLCQEMDWAFVGIKYKDPGGWIGAVACLEVTSPIIRKKHLYILRLWLMWQAWLNDFAGMHGHWSMFPVCLLVTSVPEISSASTATYS